MFEATRSALERALFAVVLCLLAAGASSLHAQTQSATVRGAVQDATGAVIPGAVLTLTNLDQNRPWTTQSNQVGEYVFQQIPPGTYSLTVEAAGFKRYERPRFILSVAQIAEINPAMELGAVTETIEVSAQTPLLETASSTLGEVVNARTTESLPLNGRNVLQLVQLTPGIAPTRAYLRQTVGSGSIGSAGFSANGGRDVANNIMLDGSPQEVMGYNQPAFIPSPDAVQEFKVQTNALSAEYGRSGGAVVNLVHRSGTNEFHGVLYEFLRNDAIQANDFFSNANAREKPPFRFNQYGFTFGGPLDPDRDSTFFFMNFEGRRSVAANQLTTSVPTPRMKQGDFSEDDQIISDPLTIDASGVRQPFPNQTIPQSRFNPVGENIVGFYADPTGSGIRNNYFSQKGNRSERDTYTIKLDQRWTESNNMFGRFSWDSARTLIANHFGNPGSPRGDGKAGARNRSITLDDTWLKAGWVLHGNYGYAHHANPRRYGSEGFLPSTLGFPQALDQQAQIQHFPRIVASGFTDLGNPNAWHIGNKFETHTWTGDMSKLFGSHTVKFGGVYRLNRVSNWRPSSPSGTFNFNRNFTRRIFNRGGGGNSIASMLLGLPAGGFQRNEPPLSQQVVYWGLYFQDDWRITNRLTINMGLRWDQDRNLTERFDRASFFDTGVPLPLNVPGLGDLRGGLQFANRDGNPRSVWAADNNNFAPRLGIAYKLTQRLVIRTGGGIFFNPRTGFGPGSSTIGAVSFNANTPVVSTTDGGRTFEADLTNPFPEGFNQPENGANGVLTFLGQGIPAVLRNQRTGYSGQWNFNIQYEIPGDALFDIAYAGNTGVKLLGTGVPLNHLPAQFLDMGQALDERVPNPFFGIISPTVALGRATVQRKQLLRTFPQFSGVNIPRAQEFHSTYHSMQLKVRKRYSQGLQFLAAYTFSKLIDDVSSVQGFLDIQNAGYTNPNNKRMDKSLSALDYTHRLVFNYQWDLPFGQGQPFANTGGWVNQVIGGWSLNGVTTLQSGAPLSVGSRFHNVTNFALAGRNTPDRVAGQPAETDGPVRERLGGNFGPRPYLNPNAFADPESPTRFGNVSNRLPDAREPIIHQWNLNISKEFPIRERFRVQFRAEFFNFFNQVNFRRPNTTFGQPNFGVITAAEAARITQFGLKFYF